MRCFSPIALAAVALVPAWGDDVPDPVMLPPQDSLAFVAATAAGDVTVRALNHFPDIDRAVVVHVDSGETAADIAEAARAALEAQGLAEVSATGSLLTVGCTSGYLALETTNGALPLPPTPAGLTAAVAGHTLSLHWSVPADASAYDKVWVLIDGTAIPVATSATSLDVDLEAQAVPSPSDGTVGYQLLVVTERAGLRGGRAAATAPVPPAP